MKYFEKKIYWTYQCGISWPNDYIGPDSMGFTDVGLLKISESVQAYAYLILSSHASARSSIVENMAGALTAQSAFLNNFEDIFRKILKDINTLLATHLGKLIIAWDRIFICYQQYEFEN